MKKYFIYHLIMFVSVFIISCKDNEENNNQQYKSLEKNIYYCCENDYASDIEWDAMIIKNDTALFAKRDTSNNNVLYFLNNIKNDVSYGIFYLISESGLLISIGNTNCFLHIASGEYEDYLWTLDEEGKIISIPITKQKTYNSRKLQKSNSKKKSIWTALNNIVDLGGLINVKGNPLSKTSQTKDVYELTENLRKGKDNEFLFNASKMTLIGGLSMVEGSALSTVGAPGLGLFFWGLKAGIENSHLKFREKLYGTEVCLWINSFKENTDGSIAVNVSLSGIKSIPKYIYKFDDYECIPSLQNKNYIMLGVLARCMFEPDYNYYDYCTQEIAINLYGEDEQSFNLTLPSMPSGKYYVRPYIRSNREEIFNRINQSIDKDDVEYGQYAEYKVFNGRITGFDLRVSEYNEENQNLHFVYYVMAELSSIKDVEEWGIYEEVDGRKIVHKMANFSSKQQYKDDIRFEEMAYPDYLDYNSFNAVKVKYVGVYVKYKDFPGIDNPDNITYSEPYELLLVYHKIPHVRIVDVSYINTEIFYDINYPELHHGKTSTFNVKLDIDTQPFGNVYGEEGGLFYPQKGGYNPHPYWYLMSKIEESPDSEFDSNGYLTTKLYVYHYFKEPDKGNNNIYYRYTMLGSDNYVMPSNNYIEFVYNSAQRAYTSARLVTGDMPKYESVDAE